MNLSTLLPEPSLQRRPTEFATSFGYTFDCLTAPSLNSPHQAGAAYSMQHAPCNRATLTLHHYQLPRVHHLSSENCKRKPLPPATVRYKHATQACYIVATTARVTRFSSCHMAFLPRFRFFGNIGGKKVACVIAAWCASAWCTHYMDFCGSFLVVAVVVRAAGGYAFWSSTYQSVEVFPKKIVKYKLEI